MILETPHTTLGAVATIGLPVKFSVRPSRSSDSSAAALSYARCYSLFTLAGIAGEDDLDARTSTTGAGKAGSGR